MTPILGTSYKHPERAMITDGTTDDPARGVGLSMGAMLPGISSNSDCPAVWFIASTGKIAPPPEAIKGPYRVSELQAMISNGDLLPFSLVSLTLVGSY